MSAPNVTVFGKDSRITFGKHRGRLLEEVIADNPEYLVWAHNNIEWFELDKKVLDTILLLTTGKIPKEKEVSPEDDTPLFDKSLKTREQQDDLFDTFDKDSF